jgi:hypothetical protein
VGRYGIHEEVNHDSQLRASGRVYAPEPAKGT